MVGIIFLSLTVLIISLVLLVSLLTVSNRYVHSSTLLDLFLWPETRIYFAEALFPL